MRNIKKPASVRTEEVGPRAVLQPNHTHFLLVDGGPSSEGKFYTEIGLRTAVEDALCSSDNGERPISTVMVTLVVGGGLGTLSTVVSILEKARPVVVLADSGGAADDIHAFVVDGVMPTNDEVDSSSDAHAKRQQVVDVCAEKLPKIQELGSKAAGGLKDTPLLTFVSASTRGPVAQNSTEFMMHLLGAVLSNCPSRHDAAMHAVNRPLLKSSLTRGNSLCAQVPRPCACLC
jgi:hypothetical protein